MDSHKTGREPAPATEVKNNFGYYLDASQRGPVEITKNGRTCAVLVAADEFSRLKEIEDKAWGNLAMTLHGSGDYLSAGESVRALHGLMAGPMGQRSNAAEKSKKAKAAKGRSTRT